MEDISSLKIVEHKKMDVLFSQNPNLFFYFIEMWELLNLRSREHGSACSCSYLYCTIAMDDEEGKYPPSWEKKHPLEEVPEEIREVHFLIHTHALAASLHQVCQLFSTEASVTLQAL